MTWWEVTLIAWLSMGIMGALLTIYDPFSRTFDFDFGGVYATSQMALIGMLVVLYSVLILSGPVFFCKRTCLSN